MSSGAFKIFSVFGIDIELHWTFIMLLLIVLVLSAGAPEAYVSFFLIVLLFASVLVHEISHSVTALRNGIKVSKIVLLPIGGASIIDEINIDPLKEFNIAMVGPITSLLLGGLFGFLVLFAPIGLPAQILQYLFEINILLGIFNLLPAFPMDGGRALRSFMQRKHNLYDSTMATVKVSTYIIGLIIFGTLFFLFMPNGYDLGYKEFLTLWNFLIVFFLYGGMVAERESVTLRKESEGMSLRNALSRDYVFVGPNTHTSKLYYIMRKRKEHTVITKLDGKFALVSVANASKPIGHVPISMLAVQIPNIPSNTNIAEALYKIEGSDFGIAAVVSEGRLVGIATSRHLRSLISLHIISKK